MGDPQKVKETSACQSKTSEECKLSCAHRVESAPSEQPYLPTDCLLVCKQGNENHSDRSSLMRWFLNLWKKSCIEGRKMKFLMHPPKDVVIPTLNETCSNIAQGAHFTSGIIFGIFERKKNQLSTQFIQIRLLDVTFHTNTKNNQFFCKWKANFVAKNFSSKRCFHKLLSAEENVCSWLPIFFAHQWNFFLNPVSKARKETSYTLRFGQNAFHQKYTDWSTGVCQVCCDGRYVTLSPIFCFKKNKLEMQRHFALHSHPLFFLLCFQCHWPHHKRSCTTVFSFALQKTQLRTAASRSVWPRS